MRLAILTIWAALLAATGAAAQEPLRLEETFLRIQLRQRDIRLEALIVRPEAPAGRLPLALITHGRSPSSVAMGELRAADYAAVGRDLARRGYLAAIVIRRGAGQSDGPTPVAVTCPAPDFLARFESEADELEAALKALQQRDDVDPARVIALGESAGGMAVLALAKRKPAGLRGVLNVAGGLNLAECVEKSRPALVDAVARLARRDGLPQLWLYARNDGLFPPELVDRMVSASRDAGADVRHVLLPEIQPNGHLIFRNGLARYGWQHEMDTNLRAWKLPTWSLEKARAIYRKLGLQSRADTFERYFSAPGEKAMAFSAMKRRFSYWYGTVTLEPASAKALSSCREYASDCAVIFENDRLAAGGTRLVDR